MSRFSTLVNGKHETISFRNKITIPNEIHGPSNSYNVCLGDVIIGSVHDMRYGWTAVAHIGGQMNLVEGFARRLDAAFYIINYMRAKGRLEDYRDL